MAPGSATTMTESPASRVISSFGINISPFLRMAPMMASLGNLIFEICFEYSTIALPKFIGHEFFLDVELRNLALFVTCILFFLNTFRPTPNFLSR